MIMLSVLPVDVQKAASPPSGNCQRPRQDWFCGVSAFFGIRALKNRKGVLS